MVSHSTTRRNGDPRGKNSAGSRASAPDALLNRVFNKRFRIESLIARGGMGRVYRAVQVPLRRTVALKVLQPSVQPEELADFQRRFFLEAAIAARLTHPNSVTIFDFGVSDDNIFYLAMELLEGVSLRTALARSRGFSVQRAVHIALQIGEAVCEAHQLGAIHRDLKPANVFLVSRSGDPDFVKVLDFGLVKHIGAIDGETLTQPGRFMGSPGYMAPEQIRGQRVDARCDVYALGVLLYEMLSGTPPFVRTGPIETMMAHVHDPVPSLCTTFTARRIPMGLGQVVEQCLAKDPAQRLHSMRALCDALRPWASNATVFSRGPTPSPGPRLFSPQPMDEDEAAGWSVVSTTGILARPPGLADVPAPASGPEALGAPEADDNAPTAAMDHTQIVDLAHTRQMPTRPVARPGTSTPTLLLDRRNLPHLSRFATHRRSRSRWRVGALVAACVLTLGLGGWRLWQHAADDAMDLHLTSSPPGAQVYVDEKLFCDHTPCTVDVGAMAKSVDSVRLRFVLDGFDEFVTSRRLTSRRVLAHAALWPAMLGS